MRRAVPVDGGFNGEIVLHENLEGVVLVGFDERSRLLTVDQIDRAGESIYNAVNDGIDHVAASTNRAPPLPRGQ
jgi:hypothetical protein